MHDAADERSSMKTLTVSPNLRMEGTWFGLQFKASVVINSSCTVTIEWPLQARTVVGRVTRPYDPHAIADGARDGYALTVVTLPTDDVEFAENILRQLFAGYILDLRSVWMYQSHDGEPVEIADRGIGQRKITITINGGESDADTAAGFRDTLAASELVIVVQFDGERFLVLLDPLACENRLKTYDGLLGLLEHSAEDGCE